MLRALIVILLALWLFGLITHIVGIFIHLLLVLAVVLLVVYLVRGRSAA